MLMIIANKSVITKAAKSAIWALYTNLTTWPQWDEDIEYARLEGSKLIQGVKGVLKPKGGLKVKFEVVEVTTEQSFTNTSYLPLTKMIFAHYLKDNADGTITITHHIEMKGMLAPLFAFIIGRKIKNNLPDAMNKLANLAEHNF